MNLSMEQGNAPDISKAISKILEEEERDRRPCCPLDPPERAEPNPTFVVKQHRKARCQQSQRELYQNQFPTE